MIQAGWSRWTEVSSVLCDKSMSARKEVNVNKMVVVREASDNVRLGHSGSEEKSGGRSGGGRDKDVELLFWTRPGWTGFEMRSLGR